MVLINGQPIISHIMNIYINQGFKEFVFALGYKGDFIKRWILDKKELNGNLFVDFQNNSMKREEIKDNLELKIHAIDTGLDSQTGGRIKICMEKFPGESFMATYGDGLGNININNLINFHKQHGKLATITAVRPPARFGEINLDGNKVKKFSEKPQTESGWINGGFFVFEPEVSSYILDVLEPLETGALPRLAIEDQLMAFRHEGFWMPMDTLRERNELSRLAKLSNIPWLNF